MYTAKMYKAQTFKPFSILSVFFIGLGLSACQPLPDTPHNQKSIALTESVQALYRTDNSADTQDDSQYLDLNSEQDSTRDNPLARNNPLKNQSLTSIISTKIAKNPQTSGYHPILNGAEAFAMRSIFTGMASKSIDVQYYIWHNDETGQLLLKDLWLAAERGVIVRLLLDDFNNNAKLDAQLRRFASHPNIAVRLVNPFAHRRIQALNYITDMRRINHRMHNKSMTFDRQVSIIGGRNVGDEYFNNSKGSQFADLDVLLIGEVVQDVNTSFEQYWRSEVSYDIETLINEPTTPTQPQDFLTGLVKIDYDNHESLTHLLATTLDTNQNIHQNSIVVNPHNIQAIPFRWRPMQFLDDDVLKLNSSAPANTHLIQQLRTLLGKPSKQLTIISSYFVPTADGVDALVELAEQGVEIKILTNSFAATDVTAVHSGYEKWRKPMLEAGIKLFELKAIASKDDRKNKLWKARSQSATSLHAKTFAIDTPQVFIGSYNVDPRSANINTEMGVLIDDLQLSTQLHSTISADTLRDQAYEVLLDEAGELQWRSLEDDQIVIYNSEPDVDMGDKFWMQIMSWLAIDWLL